MTTPLSGELAGFTAQLPFQLDDFQRRACQALQNGHGVLVCAPTGAGKTVVGEFAVHLALAAGGKCFYTTPIKALSNQKHNDLVQRYGPEKIGLLTGDQSINGDADIVVMTTEVLRNMLYANSPALQGLSYVVMDEVHFLADRMRGAVWEEVILHLPDEVRLVSLSATVSNAEEFGGWIQTVRGDTTVVVDEHRPVPLWQHVMVGKRLFDLFDYRASGAAKTGRELLVDPELLRHIAHRREADRLADWQPRGRGGRAGPPNHLSATDAAGCDQRARPRGTAARDHVRVLPRRLRRRGQAMPALVAAADHRRGTGSHRRGGRPADRRPQRGRPDRARLSRMARRAAARAGRTPRRNAADLPPHGRRAVHRRPCQGGIRHGDIGIGHQHAGPHGGAGAVGQVQRRAACAVDTGGVHAADGPGRTAGHRRRGPRSRVVAP